MAVDIEPTTVKPKIVQFSKARSLVTETRSGKKGAVVSMRSKKPIYAPPATRKFSNIAFETVPLFV